MNDWLNFDGTARLMGDLVELTARDSSGVLMLSAPDVKVESEAVRVRRGAVAMGRELAGERPGEAEMTQTRLSPTGDRLPTEKTYCIGLLEFRCIDDVLLGPCYGHWDCSN